MQDFLTFKTFITPSVLILMYYLGAVFIPMLSWYILKWVRKNYMSKYQQVQDTIQNHLTARQRIIFILIFIGSFIFMELLWRMMFEFLIAYFNMHDALMKIYST